MNRDRRLWPRSIAVRLSLWYATCAFGLILAATGFLYWVLATNFEREDARFARDELNNIRLVLNASPIPSSSWRSVSAGLVPDDDRELYLRLLAPSGAVVVETPGMDRIAPPPVSPDLTASRGDAPVRHSIRTAQGDLFETLTAPVATDGSPTRGFVQLAMNRGDEERLLAIYRRRLALVLSLSLIASAAIGYLIARSGMRPIRRIGETAERVGSSTLHERIATAGLPAELSGLAETFNTMLDRLEQSFGQMSRFSDDVAHELRTPVNNLRGEIEVALSKARSSEEYRDLLGSSLEECARISRIISGLLFLARAEGGHEALQAEEVDIAREIDAVRDFYEAAASDKGVTLSAVVDGSPKARLDRILFQQAIGNLVSNAIAHTEMGGDVRLEARSDAAGLHLLVADTGCGIAPEHLPHVFERFYRADSARSGADHAGLGLAIVRSIIERHSGRVAVDSWPGGGTRVSLLFPAE
ncbi:heavy metal sensor histidine kinase [Sphingomonas sp. H39-1-10]|uniref:heavy metal sensor histidine kinase n=1 Tax=Sphingomonas pollutisoli TaxID=3030829 RepID=UPI0023B9C4CB|nr:heavy metal sensor histidine kinase [Sphingomonas pollutisoli]MDF0491392.1 heavy metal sensor histidine kinase [Sphingomonas pollutisoli]